MRARSIVAGAVAVVAALLPVGLATPAQAAQAVRMLEGNCGSYSTLTANCANLPILVEAGIVSGAGGATAATGATAAAAGTGAVGTLGFGTVLGATGAAVGLGLLKVFGVDEGVYVETDPEFSGPSGPSVCLSYTRPSSQTGAEFFGPIATATAAQCFDPVSVAGGWEIQAVSVPSSPRWGGATFEVVTAGSTGTLGWAYMGTTNGWSSATYCNNSVNLAGMVVGQQFTIQTNCEGMAGTQQDWVFLVGRASGGLGWSDSGTVLGTKTIGTPHVDGYHGTIRTTVGCRAPGSTQLSYVTATARVDVEQGGHLPVPPVRCDAGMAAVSMKVEYQADGTTEWVELGSGDATATVAPLIDDYPDCFSPTGAALCELQLQRKNGSTWESCGPLASYCPSWVEEWSETPELFRCKYGNYDVPIERCSAFRKPGTLLPNTEEDGDETPQPIPPTAPAPDVPPNPVRDPETGEEVDLGELIDTDGSTRPEPEARQCWPTGWGVLNPFSWVFQPLWCAFVPRQSVIDSMLDDVEDAAEETAPGQVISAMRAWAFEIPEGSCEGITITWPWLPDEPQQFLASCPGDPFEGMAIASRWASFLVVAVAGVFAIVRYIAGVVEYRGFGGSA